MVVNGDSKDGRPAGVQSVERALDLLEALAAADEPRGLTQLTAASGLPLATVHRLLATLSKRGYTHQEPHTRKYVLGPSVLKLRNPYSRVLAGFGEPFLQEAAARTRETANLAILDGTHVVYVAQAAAPRRLRTFAEVGNRVLPHSNAVGKALLAFQPRAETARVVARNGLPRRTDATITEADAFEQELDRVAERGYAVDHGEEEEGVRCVAVPVFVMGQPVAAMSVSGPASRMDGHDREHMVACLQELASGLSEALAVAEGAATTLAGRP